MLTGSLNGFPRSVHFIRLGYRRQCLTITGKCENPEIWGKTGHNVDSNLAKCWLLHMKHSDTKTAFVLILGWTLLFSGLD